MIRIIDATLSLLDDYNLTRERIYCFIDLMGGIGVKDLLISINTYYTLDGELPEGFHFYLEVDTSSYIHQMYPSEDENIRLFFTPKQKKAPKDIPTFHINDLEEPLRMDDSEQNGFSVLVGLDNLMLGGSQAGMDMFKKRFSLSKTILYPEDSFHCATAIAVQFLQEKGYAVVSSILGVGNKACTEQILMALHVLERYMVNRSFHNFSQIGQWMEEVTGKLISPMQPVMGRKIFYVESGVHVDGILKKPGNYEPYPPEEVGLNREVVLGKHSGKNSILYKMEQLRPDSLAVSHIDEILAEVKMVCRTSRKPLTDDDFIKIIEGYERNETTP